MSLHPYDTTVDAKRWDDIRGSMRVYGVVASISVDSGRRAAATGRVRKEREEQHSLFEWGVHRPPGSL